MDGLSYVTLRAGTFLGGVWCTSATACTAVGDQGASTLAEGWNGARWSVQPTPSPPASKGTFFEGVSCAPGAACTAAGYYDASTRVLTLAERRSPVPGAGAIK